MLKFLQKNWFTVLFISVLIFIFLFTSNYYKPQKQTIRTVTDTLVFKVSDTIYRKIYAKGSDAGSIPPNDSLYIASKNYDSLLTKFNTLVKANVSRKFYRDTVTIDSLGYIVVHDTVQYNALQNRSYIYNYQYPKAIRTTVIMTEPAKRQIYLGGGISTQNAQLGVLYKDRKDKIIGAYVSPPINGPAIFGIQMYWKIGNKK